MTSQFTRKNQSPLRRQSSSSLPGTPSNQSPVLVLNDDASEMRDRRLHKMIERQISQSPRGSYNPIAHLNAVQLADHYANCMKLSTQNKINSKNAFQLQLIDYMAMMLKKEDPQMENFQVASCTLDASAKIYACRVDNVHNEANKLVSNFLWADKGKKKHENILETLENGLTGKQNKTKRSSMIAGNLKRLNIRDREPTNSNYSTYRWIASKFEKGKYGGYHLLQSLRIYDDSQEYKLHSDACSWREHQPEARIPSTFVNIPALNFNAINSAEICPSFSSFTFNGWKPELVSDVNQSSQGEDFGEDKVLERDPEHAFDMGAIPEEVPMDEDPGPNEDITDDLEMEKLGFMENGSKSSFEYVSLRNSLSLEPQEYSYFRKAANVGWSGPMHWKVKPILRKNEGERVSARRKSNERLPLEYDRIVSEDDFKESKKNLCLKNCTIDSWNDLKTTFPRDLNIYPSYLSRLFLKPKMALNLSTTGIIRVDGLNPFNFKNKNDMEDYCSNIPMDETQSENSMEVCEMESVKLPDMKILATESGYDLVPCPSMVPNHHIPYALKPKRFNMKRLQEVIYAIINQRGNTQEETNSKEPERLRGTIKFADIYKKIPGKLPAKEALNLNIHIVFVATLNVVSLNNLHLYGSNNLVDITVSQGDN